MGSKKRSSWTRQKAEFQQQLVGSDLDSLFERERAHRAGNSASHEAALRRKACESKNRYWSEAEAEEAIELCAEHGRTGLHCYRCRYCDGWHLTSKPML
jgi:hypothetical protein